GFAAASDRSAVAAGSAPRGFSFCKGCVDMIALEWTRVGPPMAAAFLGSLVECIEALTVVLAVATVRGWRSALLGAGAGAAFLAALICALGPALGAVPMARLQLGVGVLRRMVGLFIDDGSLAAGLLAWVAVAGIAPRFELLKYEWAGPVWFLGCIAILVENLLRAARQSATAAQVCARKKTLAGARPWPYTKV